MIDIFTLEMHAKFQNKISKPKKSINIQSSEDWNQKINLEIKILDILPEFWNDKIVK